MKRAIITGGTGAIGTALIRKLISCNVEILVLVRKDSKRNINIPKHPLIETKICDLNQLKELQNDTKNKYVCRFKGGNREKDND